MASPAASLAARLLLGVSVVAGAFAVRSPVVQPFAGASAAEVAFVDGIDDLPLMPGLAPVEDAGLVFDKPAGRIVEAVAVGRVASETVHAFYARTVPQLGWRPVGADRFVRDGETLELDVTDVAGLTTVRFTLLPR